KLVCARVSAAGHVLDPDGIPVDASLGTSRPLVSWDGTSYAVLSSTGGQHLAPNGTSFGAPFALPANAGRPVASGDGATLAIAGPTARALDASFQIAGTATIPAPAGATLQAAYAAGTFLVAWVDASFEVVGVRLSKTGTLLDAAPFTIDRGVPFEN